MFGLVAYGIIQYVGIRAQTFLKFKVESIYFRELENFLAQLVQAFNVNKSKVKI